MGFATLLGEREGRRGVEGERRAPFGRLRGRLGDDEASPRLVFLERELDERLGLVARGVAPAEPEPALGIDLLDDRLAHAAVAPAEDARAAGADVELDLICEPLFQALC